MKKIILGSVIILLIIITLIIVISNALRYKLGQQLNQSSLPTLAPHNIPSSKNNIKTSSSQNPQTNQTNSINNTATNSNKAQNTQTDIQSQNSQFQILAPSNPKLISQKDKDNMQYLNNFIPYDTEDFSIDYSSILNKYIVATKGGNGESAFSHWAKENSLLDTLNNKNIAIISNKTIQEVHTLLPPELQPTQDPQENTSTQQKQISLLLNLFNVFFSIPDTATMSFNYDVPTPTPTAYLQPSIFNPPFSSFPSSSQPSTNPQTGGDYIYFSQCEEPYREYPLTSSKTICQCGCGPTTVSMILSSYLGRSITPPDVVEIYKSQGRAQCGTSLGSAKKIMGEQGVKISDYIVPYNENGYKIEDVANDMKSYVKNGWTIFVLASFSSSSSQNHFFWITNIDDQNNVFAYDPYYGSGKIPPINQNGRYPYPKYLAAFGVRK